VAAQVTASIAAAVSEFKINRQVEALSRAYLGISWAFLYLFFSLNFLFSKVLCVGYSSVFRLRLKSSEVLYAVVDPKPASQQFQSRLSTNSGLIFGQPQFCGRLWLSVLAA